ncbi:MAG: hypothetical protein FJ215_03425 [Ignavibacteria bacterium]|nr:hypothetical protein [Ignavibacteria bacterium]
MRLPTLIVPLVLALPGLIFAQVRVSDKPRVMVVIEERVDNQTAETGIVGTAVEEAFLSKGFRLVDKQQFEAVRLRDLEVAEGNRARAKEVGMRYGAEMIIVGKSEAALDAEQTYYGVLNYVYAGKVSVKMIITDTGELIAVSSQTAKKSAQGKSSASSLALKSVAALLADDLLAKLHLRLKEEEGGRRIVQLALLGIDDRLVARYEQSLPREIDMIEGMRLRYLEKDGAVFEVDLNGTIDQLRQVFSTRNDLVVVGFTGSRLDVSTRGNVDRARTSTITTSPLDIVEFAMENIFPAQVNYYARNPLAELTVANTGSAEIRNVKVSLFVPNFMALPSESIVPAIPAGSTQKFQLPATFDAKQLYALNANASAQARIELSYAAGGEVQTRNLVRPVTIYNRSTINWSDGESAGAFITETDDLVAGFSRTVVGSLANTDLLGSTLPRSMVNAIGIWNGIRAHGINYVGDPWKSSGKDVLDQIQYPRETLSLRSGDCDDTSILLTSCLENIGIRTILVGTSDHVFIMFDTGLKPKNGYLVSHSATDYAIHENSIWIPLETTMINDPFPAAWKAGAREFHRARTEGRTLDLIDVRKAKDSHPPMSLPPATQIKMPAADRVVQLTRRDITDYQYGQAETLSALLKSLRQDPAASAREAEAELLAKSGEFESAHAVLRGISSSKAHNCRGNTFLLENNLLMAQEEYQRALELDPNDGGLYLNFGLARYLAGSSDDATEAFQAAISKFSSPEEAFDVLGLDRVEESLGLRANERPERRVAKGDIFQLLSKSLEKLPDPKLTSPQSKKVRERYKDERNRFVFGGRRGADPTQITGVREFLYWKLR